jgi:circadian clock protein KaiB
MELPQHNHTPEASEAAPAGLIPDDYVFRLYVAGTTPRSMRAIRNLAKVCEERLAGHYDLEVIDIYQQPARVQAEQIIAVPTLCKELPPPARKLIGDLSNERELMAGLGLPPDSLL